MTVVAHCQIKNRMIPEHHLNQILQDCRHMGIEEKDICLNFSRIILQAGRQFDLIINLFIPGALPAGTIQQIKAGLPVLLARHLRIKQEDIWLTTTLTQA